MNGRDAPWDEQRTTSYRGGGSVVRLVDGVEFIG
jgi:hypothetical protein